jgi:hypothetical protein
MFMQEIRIVELPYRGDAEIMLWPEVVHVIVVFEQDELAPVTLASSLGVPLPMIDIPLPERTVMPVDQLQEPAGIWMASPSTAVCVGPLMTAFTSD